MLFVGTHEMNSKFLLHRSTSMKNLLSVGKNVYMKEGTATAIKDAQCIFFDCDGVLMCDARTMRPYVKQWTFYLKDSLALKKTPYQLMRFCKAVPIKIMPKFWANLQDIFPQIQVQWNLLLALHSIRIPHSCHALYTRMQHTLNPPHR